MSATNHRSRPRNPNPRPHRTVSSGRPARGRKKTLLWLAITAVAGVITYAATGPMRARMAAAPAGRTAAAVATPAAGPRIQFASTVYDFGKATGDDLVDCTFVFTNTGNALLEVSQVNPGCGCMKAGEWTRKVEPGRTGTIPVRYDSHHYPPGPFAKSVFVVCNDAGMPAPMLEIKGTVWRPFELIPQSAALNLSAEMPSNFTSVRIISHLDEPLTLTDLMNDNPSLVVELQTNKPGSEYQVNVRTTPPWPTNRQAGHITLKTSATNAPIVDIPSYVNVQPVVMVTPYVVRIPASPITNTITTFVQVRSFGTNPVTVSEATLTIPGVDTQIKVDDPGKMTTVTMSFPAGFEIPAGGSAELQIKTDHPLYPLLKVPVLQVSRPTAPATAAPAPIKR